MTNLDISLPEDMRAFVEAEMAREGCQTASEYSQALIRQERRRQSRRDLDAKLGEGLRGPTVEMTTEDWATIRREALGDGR